MIVGRLYFSLSPPPTPAPLLCTETVASENPHPAAAETLDAPRARIKERQLANTLIVADGDTLENQLLRIIYLASAGAPRSNLETSPIRIGAKVIPAPVSVLTLHGHFRFRL